MGEQALAHRAVALAIMLQPSGQLPGRQRLIAHLPEQPLGIGAVGARQRHKDPIGRPGGDRPLAHRFLQRLGQGREQRQAPVDPAGVLAHAFGQGALAHPLGLHRREPPGLLDGLEGAGLMTGQHLSPGLGQPTVPHHALRGVPPQPPQGLPAPVAIDQHPPLAAVYHHQRHLLATRLQGGDQTAHRLVVVYAGGGEGGVDAMPVDRLATVAEVLV
jgi:hypothetical protein